MSSERASEVVLTPEQWRELYEMTHDGKCPTRDCLGDERYAAPGRGHIDGCTYPQDIGWVHMRPAPTPSPAPTAPPQEQA